MISKLKIAMHLCNNTLSESKILVQALLFLKQIILNNGFISLKNKLKIVDHLHHCSSFCSWTHTQQQLFDNLLLYVSFRFNFLKFCRVTWYNPTNCSLSCLTLILMLDGVNNRVSFVDNIITVETAVARDRDIPLIHFLVSVCVNIRTSVAELCMYRK